MNLKYLYIAASKSALATAKVSFFLGAKIVFGGKFQRLSGIKGKLGGI